MTAQAEREIPLVRLDAAEPGLIEECLAAIERIAGASAFTFGAEVEAFEAEWAAYCESDHCVSVSSGTDALALVLRALGIGPGDEVVVPANSFIATAEAVSLAGATPAFADVDGRTGNITESTAAAALTPRTRAIIAVHLWGRTAEMAPILALGSEHGIPVVEDAAQAHGARYRGARAGSMGIAGCFSFYPAKNLGAWGDGGAVVTDDPQLADRVRLLRSHGERVRYRHELIGTTARLDAIQAAVLRVKLRRLDEWTERRRAIARAFTEGLSGAAVTPPEPPGPGHDHVVHQYVVQTEDRDGLREHLRMRGVATAVHYPVALHTTPAYAHLGDRALPVAERLADRICSLPVFPRMTDADIDHVVQAVGEWQPGR